MVLKNGMATSITLVQVELNSTRLEDGRHVVERRDLTKVGLPDSLMSTAATSGFLISSQVIMQPQLKPHKTHLI